MTRASILIANRGEIALRIIRTARERGLDTVAVYADDDADSPHVHAATSAVALGDSGPAAYLNHQALIDAATSTGCTLVHPGYGFLSENAEFADACFTAGLTFVGPDSATLRLFGDKVGARAAAIEAAVPVLAATDAGATVEQVRTFLTQHPGGIVIKALAGGGGRGIRLVHNESEVDDAYRACAAEALLGFGNSEVFAEALFADARHIEVQVAGDGRNAVALGDRDCSVQRRHQKLIEIAPAPNLSDTTRRALHAAATRLCSSHAYRGLATVEFLVKETEFVFLEVNPRIQVEHTVTEEVTGLDLVGVQLDIAQGRSISHSSSAAKGFALQARVNMETFDDAGNVVPTAGTLTSFAPPTGRGVRVDTFGRRGLRLSPRYDSLLAKVIVHTDDPAALVDKADAALAEFDIEGIATNIAFLRAILSDKTFEPGAVSTSWLGDHLVDLAAHALDAHPAAATPTIELRADETAIRTNLSGVVVEIAGEGDAVATGSPVAVLEAMKMQHAHTAPHDAEVVRVLTRPGQALATGDVLAIVRATGTDTALAAKEVHDIDTVRGDLAEILDRHRRTLDEARPAAVEKRHGTGRRMARENIMDLVDDGSFVEYGALALAAQRSRRSEQDLIDNTPADGLVGGLATIGAETFGASAATAVVMSYDYTVLAGTQGMRNHSKTDRLLELATRRQVPVVLFAEGGGGRPGDTDAGAAFGLDLDTFYSLAALNGSVPLVAVVSGRCFAGNAALAGVCDVLIATPDANIGMGGPAMVEGGGLGTHRPTDIGPIEVQRRNGVVYLVARDDAHAVALAKQYLSYFQGSVSEWTAPDPRTARHVVPENRLRAYDVRSAIDSIADVGSVLELRPDYGVGIVTALVRVEGAPFGMLANSSHHLGGAIDAEASDKAADFLTLCQSHDLPVVTLCDTPGFMVGPESEKEATVRRFGRMFIAGARLTVPFGTIILRKGYGLGAMAMAGGSFHAGQFTVAWPTGEIGPMGLEGAVRLGFRKELEAADNPAELFDQLVAMAYERGKALYAATTFELDDVIDPADSRAWIRRLRL